MNSAMARDRSSLFINMREERGEEASVSIVHEVRKKEQAARAPPKSVAYLSAHEAIITGWPTMQHYQDDLLSFTYSS